MTIRNKDMDVEKVVLNNVCLKRLLELHCFKREDVLVEGMSVRLPLPIAIQRRMFDLAQTVPEDSHEYQRLLFFHAYQAVSYMD